MNTTWTIFPILLVVFMALFAFAVVIGVMVIVFRAATRSSRRPADGTSNPMVPPVLGDDSLTNPANPLYHIHHLSTSGHDASSHHSPSFDSTPSHSPSSFDSGSAASSSFDSGSSSAGSTSDGSGCG